MRGIGGIHGAHHLQSALGLPRDGHDQRGRRRNDEPCNGVRLRCPSIVEWASGELLLAINGQVLLLLFFFFLKSFLTLSIYRSVRQGETGAVVYAELTLQRSSVNNRPAHLAVQQHPQSTAAPPMSQNAAPAVVYAQIDHGAAKRAAKPLLPDAIRETTLM